jgi:sterol desaturase/sphingolipid hydroxylase (fatty acid hydroxylase superfamily)
MDALVAYLSNTKIAVAAGTLAILWFLEHWIPFYQDRKSFLRHDATNLAMTLFNFLVLSVTFTAVTAYFASLTQERGWGLLNLVAMPSWLHAVAAIVILDGWLYGWHRASHESSLLWRFHRMHHTDAQMDASSALRFHTIEVALSALTRAMFLPLLGVQLWEVLLYELLLAPLVQLHHSNLNLGRFDNWMRLVLVSPNMHRVHHSRLQVEHDSNFSSVFSVWDRLFGSYNSRADSKNIKLGLDGWDAKDWQGFAGLLKTPFRAK